MEPERAGQALEMIGQLYAVERHIREANVVGEARRAYRLAPAKPVAHQFFTWIDAQFESQGLLPSSSLTTAMAYVRERRAVEAALRGQPAAIRSLPNLEVSKDAGQLPLTLRR